MDKYEQHEILQRLKIAQRRSQEAFEKTEKGWDLHVGTQIANWWMFMTAGYSGIEQSFKYIIAMERGTTVENLIKEERSIFLTHDLGCLYDQMSEGAKQVLNEYYERFQSLHNYIEIETLQDFMKEVSGTGGQGYGRWRYALIQPGPIPRSNVDSMIAIWDACVQWITVQQYPSRKIQMPEMKLLKDFEDLLQKMYREPRLWRQTGDKRPANAVQDLREWYEDYGHPINAFAQLIWNDYRGISIEESVKSNWLASLLRVWLERTEDLCRGKNRANLFYFIERAKGNTGFGLGIRWNVEQNRFENIPWNLEEIMKEEVPDAAIKMDGQKTEMHNRLLQKVHKDGFDVKENGFRSQQTEDETWMCTLVAEKEQASGGKVVIKVWEQGIDTDLYVEMESTDSREMTEAQGWIQCWASTLDQE